MSNASDFSAVLLNRAVTTQVEYIVDLDAYPFRPQGWEVEEHQRGGQWKYDPKKIEYFLASGQKSGKFIEGNKLRKELAKKPVFNANLLDFWLANKHLIPEELMGKSVFFWGTIFKCSGRLYVRYLCSSGGRLYWSGYWLDGGWHGFDFAALRVESGI